MRRPGPFWTTINFILFFIVAGAPFLSLIAGESDLGNAPDLAISEFSIKPTRDGFQGYLRVMNIGRSSSALVNAVIMDEPGQPGKNASIVGTFPIPILSPARFFEKNFRWDPLIDGPHTVWVVLDNDNTEFERSKSNNVKLLSIELPELVKVSSKKDGNRTERMFGDYITGVENNVDLDLGFEGVDDPSLMRVYIEVSGKLLEYAAHTSGSDFTAIFNPGALEPGLHELTITATYAGLGLRTEVYHVNVVEKPRILDHLQGSEIHFDNGKDCYIGAGYLDIPTDTYRPTIDGIGQIDPILLFDGGGELFISLFVLLDGTTTLETVCTMRVSAGEDTISVSGSRTTFHPSPEGPMELAIEAVEEAVIDLSPLIGSRMLSVPGPLGGRIDLPVSPLIRGTIGFDMRMRYEGENETPETEVEVAIDMEGGSQDVHSLPLPGMDRPLTEIALNTSIEGKLVLKDDIWTDHTRVLQNHTVSITDLGLGLGPEPSLWNMWEQGMGTDTALSPDDSIGQLELSLKEGSVTRLILRDPYGEFEVYRNNTYKSSPDLEYTHDGRPLVLWSEASYAEDYIERASSMRLMYVLGDGGGNFSSGPFPLYPSSSSDLQPTMAADHYNGELSVAWVRDLDGDPRTLSDREIMVGTFDGSGWSAPLALTDDSVMDQEPDIWYSPMGDIWISWLSCNTTLRYATRPREGDWSSSMELDTGRTLRVHEHCLAGGGHAFPVMAMTASEPGGPYELLLVGGGDSTTGPLVENMTLIGSDHYLGSPGMVVQDGSLSHVFWLDHSTPGGDIYSSMNEEGPLEDAWTSPMRITDNLDHEIDPGIRATENGLFLLSYNRAEPGPVPTDGNEGPFRVVNLSWGADIISIDLDPQAGLSIGEMVKATILLESTALYPTGIVRVDLHRRMRDRDTGGTNEEPWESRVVEFTRSKERVQVSFTVPVKEFQLGLVARTSPPLEGIPAHRSRMFVSLSAIPDPEIESLEMLKPPSNSPNATVIIGLKNWGMVDIGKWDLEVRSSLPSPPFHFPGSVFEPVHLRTRSTFSVLNSTKVDIEGGARTSVIMNISLHPGMNDIWAVIKGPSWLPEGESAHSLSVASMPLTELVSLGSRRVIGPGEPLEIELAVKNVGIWPLNISFDGAGSPHPDMSAGLPLRWAWIEVTDPNGTTLFSNISYVDDLDPGGIYMFNLSLNPLEGVLSYHIMAGLSAEKGSEGRSDPSLRLRVNVLTEPRVVITGIDDERSSINPGKGLKVWVNNPSNVTARVVHLILYNGYPRDQVIVSEALATEIGPGSSREVLLPLQLEEGRYILSVAASLAAPPVGNSSSPWREPTVEVTDISIEIPAVQPGEPDGEVDMDDVTSSVIISLAASMLVLMISSAFFKRRQEEN